MAKYEIIKQGESWIVTPPGVALEDNLLRQLYGAYGGLPLGKALLEEHVTPEVIRAAIDRRIRDGDNFDDDGLSGFLLRTALDVCEIAHFPGKLPEGEEPSA